MRCSACGYTDSRVLESRSAEGGRSVRRRRECLNCRNRFTTYERIEYVPLTVVKRNGDRESFDSTKLLRGVVRACEKTQISTSTQECIIADIEADLQQRSHREIASSELGELVLKALKPLSEVAYVRFASVYRQFQSIRDFVDTLEHLRETEHKLSPEEQKNAQENPGIQLETPLASSSKKDVRPGKDRAIAPQSSSKSSHSSRAQPSQAAPASS